MEASIIVEIINSVGFPIGMCVALFWFCQDTLKKQQELLNQFKDIIRDNTEALRQLAEKVKGD